MAIVQGEKWGSGATVTRNALWILQHSATEDFHADVFEYNVGILELRSCPETTVGSTLLRSDYQTPRSCDH